MKPSVIALTLNAHTPFIRSPDGSRNREERRFFESLSETYLPLLAALDRLERDRVPFRLGLALSPTLCQMLKDESLIGQYTGYTETQLAFGAQELKRTAGTALHSLAEGFYNEIAERRLFFEKRCEKNILKIFEYYQRKGKIELLTTAATYGFLPFYVSSPEAIQAQFEVALASYRSHFGRHPQGFWLPELGWTPELERCLRAYNFGYTVVNTHALILGDPPAVKGSFYPVRTPQGIFVFARDHYGYQDIADKERGFSYHSVYRDNDADAGYELSADMIKPFLDAGGKRTQTGYKYKSMDRQPYEPQAASEQVIKQAQAFLDARIERLSEASQYMAETPISLCAYNADAFGRLWYEGTQFLETLFREGAKRPEIQFMTPAEYLYKQDISQVQTSIPCFSSGGRNGYAQTWLDASNDWIYRHTVRSIERMTEIAERFPDETGLKERALNQAAREILLGQASDWTKMLYNQDREEYAKTQIEETLRNFTTIYEALGSNYISTEWLTNLERRHNIFPAINYRVFRRKR
ncbi:MAG: DUF1957 domain-containing protein [Spirochaetaceae bacterium]|jgi:1,4-alpha-glucan branching enzyme|nr:DUF1957 domain-containing protein [Spirochaetaceae bacterium]